MPDVPEGHVCYVIDSVDERAHRVAAWADSGLSAHERVVVVQPVDENVGLLQSLRDRGLDVDRAVVEGSLLLLTPEAVYLADGVFDLDRRIEASRAFVEQSVAEGYTAVRLASDAATVLDVVGDLDTLLAYERRVDALCRSLPVTGICIYERAAFTHTMAAFVAAFVAAHPAGSADSQLVGSGEAGRLRVSGDVDLSNVDLFEALLTAASDGDEVVVDLEAVTFIDVVATTTLVNASRRLGPERRMKVLSSSRLLLTMLDTIGGSDNIDVVTGEVAA